MHPTVAQLLHQAVALHQHGHLAQAEAIYRQILALEPDQPDALNYLGLIAALFGHHADAVTLFQRAATVAPTNSDVQINLAAALLNVGDLSSALAAAETAIRLNPTDAAAHLNRAAILKDTGRIEEAMIEYRAAAAHDPSSPVIGASLLYALYFDPATGSSQLLAAHKAWAHQFADPLTARSAAHVIDRDPTRPLRVGFVSPDFRDHGIGRFLLPLFESRAITNLELICYSDVITPDPITEQLRRQASDWHDVAGFPDSALAEKIRADRIDILIDLTLHMQNSRLMTFALKPAPLQATYLAYAGTSGMNAMDVRLTDPHLDPPSDVDAAYTEQNAYLPSYWCYARPPEAPPVAPPPAMKNNHITFGCLNNFAKVNRAVLEVWRDLLRQNPTAHLILHAMEGPHRQATRDFLNAGDRVRFVGYQSMADYLATYNEIDLALDTFPYAGGTTTCDALFMGVPVITLAGRHAVSRAGVSILHQIHHPELIASTTSEYIQLATDLAAAPELLATLRQSLRPQMLRSALMDPESFARSFESSLRKAWNHRWTQMNTDRENS